MNRYFPLLFALIVTVSGCVTQKKYNELLAEKVKAEGSLAFTQDSLSMALDNYADLEETLYAAREESSILADSLINSRARERELQGEYEELNTFYKNLLNNSSQLTRDLSEQQQELTAMRENLTNSQQINDELSKDLEEREKKVKELEDVLAKKDEAVNALKSRINNALLNFKESDLTVSVKNGKVYVSLAEQLLFKSGSVSVDPKGQTALKQLAEALKGQDDINVMVEGHTDNVPLGRVSAQYMQDNWDLSVLRATSIVKILTAAGVPSARISAAGKGEFSPVDTNETTEGKAKNRRTEIIITPDLDELFKILETN